MNTCKTCQPKRGIDTSLFQRRLSFIKLKWVSSPGFSLQMGYRMFRLFHIGSTVSSKSSYSNFFSPHSQGFILNNGFGVIKILTI